MASSSGTYCDICQSRHISKAAEAYCPVCEEALCSDCTDHHKLAKATKNHQVISIDEYNKLPAFIREIKQHCDKHGDRFEFFCPTHNELCCKRCITTTHNECKECKVIEDFVNFSKSSAIIDEYEQTIKDIDGNIQTAIDDRKENLEQFERQKQAIRKQVKDKRDEINKHFDNLEATLMHELSAIEGENKLNVHSVIEKLEENKKNNLQFRNDVDAMKQYGSNIQVFMGTTKLQEPILKQEKFVRSLQDDGSLHFINLGCFISDELNGVFTGVRSFGVVTPISSESSVRFSWESEKSAQILTSPTDKKKIENFTAKFIRMMEVDSNSTITSCFVGKYLMFVHKQSERDGYISKYDSNGKCLIGRLLANTAAFDIVFIDSDTFAVTNGSFAFNVNIVDVASLQVKRVINFGQPNWLYGATYHNGSIIACMYYTSIKRFSIGSTADVSKPTLLVKPTHTERTYLASDDNFFYHSDYTNHSVTCYDLTGNNMWSFNYVVLREPRGLCLDSDSNVYVAGSASNNIVVISSDGLHSKQLLGPENGIKAPHAIHFDKYSNRLLVVNRHGPAMLYQVSNRTTR